MMTWLDNDLAQTDQPWIVAYWHHPPYSKGSHDSDNPVTDQDLIDMRTVAVPILEDHGVDLVLSGHSHAYERSFLIDGHYGFSDTFGPEHVVDGGDGRVLGDGAYLKPFAARVPHRGAVYTVAGSSGQKAVVQFGSANTASLTSLPTLRGSTSKAATTSTSSMRCVRAFTR